MTAALSVAMVTNGRNPPLLRFLCERWLSLGAEVCISGAVESLLAIPSLVADPRARLLYCDSGPTDHGAHHQVAIDTATRPYVLVTEDDILPVCDEAWLTRLPRTPGSIQAIRLTSVRGRRWYDWATYADAAAQIQAYDQHSPDTYITGGAQLLSPEARAAVRYHGDFGQGIDVRFCREAVAAGISLLPPVPGGPELIHLDRFPGE